MLPYWHQQLKEKPLYPDIEWSKPEQRAHAGRLGVIGGNKLGFSGVAESYSVALNTGAGAVRALLPDALKKTIPASMTDVVYGASNPSGGLSSEARNDLLALGEWATGILLIGDAGRNSETAIVYEHFITEYSGMLTISRDAVDLLRGSSQLLVDRPKTVLILSFAQLQKLFQAVYYPKVLTFGMQLQQLVETLHKFTITYPITIAALHKDHLVISAGGEVITTPWETPMAIWRGHVAARASTYWLWNESTPLEAVATSLNAK